MLRLFYGAQLSPASDDQQKYTNQDLHQFLLSPSRQAAGQKVNGKKITARGGSPPPITASGLEFFRQKRRFLPKKHCFWANFQQIF